MKKSELFTKGMFLVFLLFCIKLNAKQVDTVEVSSASMNVKIKNVVILPADYETKGNLPVLYLLHGYGGNHASWIQMKRNLPDFATKYGMIIVCPDGKNSWYWDSPANPGSKYETYAAEELPAYIDSHYKTVKDRRGRAVTGLSMGGHGGLWLGIRHQDVFGACGSMSGGVDIRPFPENWEMKNALGEYYSNREVWNDHTVMTQIYRIKPSLAIIFDCGTDDFFYAVNEELHRELLYRKIKHDYITRPGAHNGEYWQNAIEYQMLFFHNSFSR
jgi:S-formylglutathione hydrolase FrmB